jgi:Transposase DDE domain
MNESDVIVPARQYAVNTRARLGQSQLRKMVKDIFNEGIHAKRVLSLANGVTGVLHTSTLAVHAIGQAYAQVANIQGKSGVKQVDRMLSSNALDLDKLLGLWVRHVVQGAKELVVIADWTHFDEDSHKTLYLQIATGHGRSVPLMWATYEKSELHNTQTDFEVIMIERLHELVAPDVHITLLGDRGFGNQRLYRLLQVYGWDFVIRFRGNILLKHGMEEGTTKSFMHKSGHAKMLKEVFLTRNEVPLPAVVLVHDKKMKDGWCLATTLAEQAASDVVKLYGKRTSIEQTFRDTKDLHFGLGLSAFHIKDKFRRDRLLLLLAVAYNLLTLLGAASEASGLDKTLKANTVNRRTMSLFNQGKYWFNYMPTMPDKWFIPLILAFDKILLEQQFYLEIFGKK